MSTQQAIINKVDKNAVTFAIVIVAIILLYFIWKSGKLVGEGVDSIKDIFGSGSEAKKADTTVKKQEQKKKTDNPFSPEFIKYRLATPNGGKSYKLIKAADKAAMIAKIEDAGFWGAFGNMFGNSPEEAIENLFKTLTNKSQVSDLANYYLDKKGKDLLTTIKQKINTGILSGTAAKNKAIADIVDYANSLPE